MIFYRTIKEDDPYYFLWSSDEWLHPFENRHKLIFPKIITVEPTNYCTNDCLYCVRQLMYRKKGFMSLDIFKKIVDESAEYNAAIRYGGFGEPLMHKKIIEFVKMCNNKKLVNTIFSNSKLLNEKIIHQLSENELTEFIFSSAGLTPESHNTIRKNSDYKNDFLSKIELFASIKEKYGYKKPYLKIYTNVFSYNEPDIEKKLYEYKNFFLKFVDKVDIDLTNFSRVKHLDKIKNYYEKQDVKEIYKPCVTLYHKFIVQWNGDVFACDMPYNFEEDYFHGNIKTTTLKKCYDSEKQNFFRRMTEDLKHSELKLCRNCFSNTNKYEILKDVLKKEKETLELKQK